MAVAGLTSVTFRELSAAEVLCLAKEAGLAGLEWGGDIHLPPECPELAEELARRTAQAGLRSLSYGSYHRLCQGMDFQPVLKAAAAQLKRWDIPFEARVMSAHRTPDAAAKFAREAAENGFGVLIAAAGMAAHLAGALAANTTLPVIGVPVKGGAADGLDALLSTVQMPSGIPVATVALNGAKNAAVLAAQILALSDTRLAALLREDRAGMAKTIAEKDAAVRAEAAAL